MTGVLSKRRKELKTPEEWKSHWQAQGQEWRTEPEISPQRQTELTQHRTLSPDEKKGIYPFGGVKLDRADVEWLLATHENGRGPVIWSDETQRTRGGPDLCGADLRGDETQKCNLEGLPLSRVIGNIDGLNIGETQVEQAAIHLEGAYLSYAHLEEAHLSYAHLEGADLRKAHLEGTHLRKAHLEGAYLRDAHLEGAYLRDAHFEGAYLRKAHLEGADLRDAHLEGADLYKARLERADLLKAHLEGAYLSYAHLEEAHLRDARLERADLLKAHLEGANLRDAHLEGANLRDAHLEGANLADIHLADTQHIGPFFADTQWGGCNLAVVEWSQISILRDEYLARQKKDDTGDKKDKGARLDEYKVAVRANRQLSVRPISVFLTKRYDVPYN